ncbi:MAG: carbohydrate kinase [Armatimonadetes bacterium]|nr:carbohydrate kinase [Armatimonadota bacterium]
MHKPVVAIGGALVDIRATTPARWMPGRSLPGAVRIGAGGAARNVAVNLARLGYPVTLATAVGDDPLGDWLLRVTSDAGVDISPCLRRSQTTGTLVAVGPDGGEPWCVSDAGPVDALEVADLEGWRAVLAGARAIVADANLHEPLHEALQGLAGEIPRVLLATSPPKAVRLRSALAGAAAVVCNRAEALAITGLPNTLSWQALGTALLTEGVERVVITLGPEGVGITTAEEALHCPAAPADVVDPTGAGDAVAAVALHGLLAGLDPGRTAALAVAAAAVVVQSHEATPSALASVIAG